MPTEIDSASGRPRVMVVDDASIVRLDLRQALTELGYDVCAEAGTGLEALEVAATTLPDIILMDIKMPDLDGIEAARRILAARSIPIVMLTAYGDDQMIKRAVAVGVYAYLVKPYRTQDLKPAIEAALARHAERAAGQAADDSESEGHSYYLSGYGYVA